MASGLDMDTFVRLIKDLRQNQVDDTDPNNVVIQKFQAVTDRIKLSEIVLLTKKKNPMVWGGSGFNANFVWGEPPGPHSDVYYPLSLGAKMCILMV